MTGETPGHDHASFDERAATWDDDAKVARARRIADQIAGELALGPSTSMFEYGAGTGLVSEALAGRVGSITLADSSSGMREQIRAKIADGRLAHAQVWDLDLSRMTAPDEAAFDLVVTSMVLHHVDPLAHVLAGFASMVKPGGHLCVVDLDSEDGSFHGEGAPVHHGFDRSDFAIELETAGFVDVRIEDCGSVDHDGTPYGLFMAISRR